MSNAFAIVHTWPDLKNAEYEVLQRIINAADNIDAGIAVISNAGSVLWANSRLDVKIGDILPKGSVDFVISLHFESPRLIDEYTYYALWQPLEFYFDFGYQKSIDKAMSHNDVISCDSDIADNHALNLLSGLGRAPKLPLPKMFHTLPEPFLVPGISSESRLFYIGINWERIGRPKGRFHDALIMLDQNELVDIYGPEKMQGVAPWEGFDSYRGELPFDGISVRNAINKSGICLALSSAPHTNAGIMSNRLFEGLAGGAAVIATPNALIDKYFSEVVYIVDDSHGEKILGQQILEALREIRRDPAAAEKRVLKGQEILRTKCSLEGSLRHLLKNHRSRQAQFDKQMLGSADISVVLSYVEGDVTKLQEHVAELQLQKRVKIDLHIVCDKHLAAAVRADTDRIATGAIKSVTFYPGNFDPIPHRFDGPQVRPDTTGKLVATALKASSSPYLALLSHGDRIFSEHFASLVKAMEEEPGAVIASSGMIVQTVDLQGKKHRDFDSARFSDLDALLMAQGRNEGGRFLFSRKLLASLPEYLMMLLDGEECRYFQLEAILSGPLAQSGYSTYVLDETDARLKAPVMPAASQQQYIRDYFSGDSRWIERLAKGSRLPDFVYAYAPGAPVRWLGQEPGGSSFMPVGELLAVGTGEGSADYFKQGFSYPEIGHIWLASDRGVIEFALDRSHSSDDDYEVALVMAGLNADGTGRTQHCTIAINNMVVSYARIPEHAAEVRIPIPQSIRRAHRNYRLEIIPDHLVQVRDDRGSVADSRNLSVQVRALGVFRRSSNTIPLLRVGTIYECTTADIGAKALVSNFYGAEANLTWMAGTQGHVEFRVDHVPDMPRLHLRVTGRKSLASGRPQVVEIKICGASYGAFELANEIDTIAVDFEKSVFENNHLDIDLKIHHAEAVFDDSHHVIDNRLLGLAILDIGVIERPSAPPVEHVTSPLPPAVQIGWKHRMRGLWPRRAS